MASWSGLSAMSVVLGCALTCFTFCLLGICGRSSMVVLMFTRTRSLLSDDVIPLTALIGTDSVTSRARCRAEAARRQGERSAETESEAGHSGCTLQQQQQHPSAGTNV